MGRFCGGRLRGTLCRWGIDRRTISSSDDGLENGSGIERRLVLGRFTGRNNNKGIMSSQPAILPASKLRMTRFDAAGTDHSHRCTTPGEP